MVKVGVRRMGWLFGLVVALAVGLPLTHASPAVAQEDDGRTELVTLSQSDIDGFLAVRGDVIAIITQAAEADDGVTAAPVFANPEVVAQLEATATGAGFDSFDHLNSVEATLAQYFTAIDPETREFIDPRDTIQAQIDAVMADDTLDDAAKAEFSEIYVEILESTPALDNETNRTLVTASYDRILATLMAVQ